MASRSAPTPAKKRTRKTEPRSFVAHIWEEDRPTLVIARTQKLAREAILSLSPASAQDLLKAGRDGWFILDTTEEPPVDETPVAGAAE